MRSTSSCMVATSASTPSNLTMPRIRDGSAVHLWLELGRVLRPDVQTGLPSFYGHEAATIPLALLWVAVAGGLETALAATGRARVALLVLTWVAVWWSAMVTFVYAVLPDLRYEYMPRIRDGSAVHLWLELGRVLRPDV